MLDIQVKELENLSMIVFDKLHDVWSTDLNHDTLKELNQLRSDYRSLQDILYHSKDSRYNQDLSYYKAIRIALRHKEG